MKLKTTIIATAMLSLTTITAAHAAKELTPEQAVELKPFERISVTGRFNAIYEAADAISRQADKKGAYSFYIQSLDDFNGGGNLRVVADLYHKDAEKSDKTTNYRIYRGIKELPKTEAITLEPFDTVTVNGYFATAPDLKEAIAKAAKKKDAASFFIVRDISPNNGGNQIVTAYVYKTDAPKRQIQSNNAVIPADSEAGRQALAQGGEEAEKVEIPGVASSTSTSNLVGRFFETQSSKGGRYTVTLSDGTKMEELNKASAAQMVPFDSITFSGYYTTDPEISYQVAKRAAKKGAKYYHVTREWQSNGGNITVSADLFK
ncbi:DUF1471 family protein YdgH [Xenorhabdus bovienii]|uniref:DUF1471 family protein YdgH n=1 Tax=Xenorhabdus bovienii TaxID=40576 RepID=UPI002157B110|nr:DUF1471 family protein YdgH [Xenorhabdus bovienii]MDE1474002.1 DUF1471 family protein YdgH [Xenorhabdus bovienii]MDE1481603.1 DUF1471 family protein YdgH [Xenorhabdus bovienii]MDE9426972.1 DUF1471 family protein YdgH [Xenorhabdus bovienii]MDE9436093.1 DUF1471 family protein YdgH [Xenorhabdus bovienii]MDE9440921.1 DUF1471 family protein YdgH [Xenorhabdus bovienii]